MSITVIPHESGQYELLVAPNECHAIRTGNTVIFTGLDLCNNQVVFRDVFVFKELSRNWFRYIACGQNKTLEDLREAIINRYIAQGHLELVETKQI